jgi:hypothetical protein
VWVITSNISKVSPGLVLEIMGSTSEWLLTCSLPHRVLKFVIVSPKLTFNFRSVANNCYKFYFTKYCHVFRDCDYRWGMDWWMSLLTTYTHDSELQVITVLLLISTLHKSPQHLPSLFQPAVSSLSISWQRLLTVEILQLHMLRSSCHRLPCRTRLLIDNWQLTGSQAGGHFTPTS